LSNWSIDSIKRVASQTLQVEAQALRDAALAVGDDFVKAVTTILQRPAGKLICTGLGKSGHIARKVAATLSSTGSPAFYIHPAEALHGDLGVISANDVLIAFAQSGQTSEVIEVARYAKRVGLPLISITGNKLSDLAKLSDVVLSSAVKEEACPLKLAPTASSTVALGIGDALAMALMDQRGFRSEDFAKYHPGGALGRKLAIVGDVMIQAKSISTVSKDTDFAGVLEKMTDRNLGIVAVVADAGNIVGAISEGDLRRAVRQYRDRSFELKAFQFMSSNPKLIESDKMVVDAIGEMERFKITALFVVESKSSTKLKGLIRLQDLMDAKIV
jgi:arabinose-5-phosphate isomerase